MKYKYPENIDPAPKRRKANDNPYEIFTVGIKTDHPHFFVRFTDGAGEHRCLEITEELYQVLNEFELRDLSFLNEVDNHYEQSELTEASRTEMISSTTYLCMPLQGRVPLYKKLCCSICRVKDYIVRLHNYRNYSAAVWSCTTLETIPTNRSEKWRDVPNVQSNSVLILQFVF